MPAEGELSSEFGYRIHPIDQTEKLHAGIDIIGGGPIVSALDGEVVETGYNPSGFGNYVRIDHGDGIETVYAHMEHDSITVSKNEKIDKGEEIGEMGTTGSSTGEHLHFEVYEDGQQVDPAPYLDV